MEYLLATIKYIFWIGMAILFYTYLGYGILLYLLVRIKELFCKPFRQMLPSPLPEVTLFIAAYNEEDIIDKKMTNCQLLSYPKDKLKIVWVTDGSNDRTNEKLQAYQEVTILYQPKRQGKTAALNRGMQYISTPYVVFTDANTMLNAEAITEIIKQFSDPKTGCVAGEKRVETDTAQGATAGEGIYWKYESVLKSLDDRLYSAVGAAGELFAIRTELFEKMPPDTLLDDFILSLKIAQKGYKIAYCKKAYATEEASLNMKEEEKRKIRIAAGGLQSIWRLRSLFNLFRYHLLSFQFISHRVLRWTITPLALFCLFPLNIILACSREPMFVTFLLIQLLFYIMAFAGYKMEQKKLRNKLFFIPYYFTFMNLNVIRGFLYLLDNKNIGIWEKAKRNKV